MNSLNGGNKHMSGFEHGLNHGKRSFTRCSYSADLQVSEFIPSIQRMISSGSAHGYRSASSGSSKIAFISVDRFTLYG
jgi:hypothetical protein